MLAGHNHRILEAAAEESVERIRQDHGKAPQRLKPLLAYIEEHLFDPSLDVNQLKRNCGVRDNSVPIQFHSAVGRPPHGYIEDRRMETACKMLSDSNLKIWQISELLGYSSIQVFSRAFSRWSGQRPTAYRKKARKRKEEVGVVAEEPMLEESLFAKTETLRKALAGELSLDEASRLIRRLRQMYPEPDTDDGPSMASGYAPIIPPLEQSIAPPPQMRAQAPRQEPQSSGADLWETKTRIEVLVGGQEIDDADSEQIWAELQRHTWAEQSMLVRDLRLTSPALFHLLRTRSRLLGREDPRRGVQVADLALKTLDVLDTTGMKSTEMANLKALGWAWLASARCLAGDLRGAEQGFGNSERFLEMGEHDEVILGDIALFKASLRRDQRQFEEAWGLLDDAAEHYRKAERPDLIGTVLIAKATVKYEEGDASEAIPHLEEARDLTDEDTDGFIRLSLYHNLVTAYAETGRYSQALELLPRTRQLSAQYGRGYHRIRLRWLEGIILRGRGQFEQAEQALVEAREAFTTIDDMISAALVCLDIAALYLRQNRYDDVERLSTSMVPLFSAVQQHRDAYVALQLFYRAAQERNVTSVIMDKARRALQQTQRRSLG